MDICRLCKKNHKLKLSHIFPRSIYKRLKKSSPQLLNLSVGKPLEAKISNSNPKEKLLCGNCEQFISEQYERDGTRLLIDPKKFDKKADVLIIKNFKYKAFYLYLISILWRASESNLPIFSSVNLGGVLNDLLRRSIYNNSLDIKDSLKIDHVIKISIVKLVDPRDEITPEYMRLLLIYINKEVGVPSQDPILYYFVVDGFLIMYHFKVYDDMERMKNERIAAQLTADSTIHIPKVDYRKFKFLNQVMKAIRIYNCKDR